MTQPVIRVQGVSKDFALPHLRQQTIKSRFVNMFGRRQTLEVQHALCDVGFEVMEGEFFGVCGRNGSGKSTLLKILAGIYVPTGGHVATVGRVVPFIELGVGFNPELTGRENVFLNGALLGFSKREVGEMYDDIVAFAELEGYMDQKLKFYSSGMQVRIAFSVATRAKADVLLIDEVLAVGDAAFQRKCFDHFHALKKRGTTIVFVTHNMSAVREFCDRAILIENSRLVSEGSAEEIAEKYTMLFTPNVQAAPGNDGQTVVQRWGEGDVVYTSVRVPEVLTEEDEGLRIELDVTAEREVGEIVYRFMISDSNGTPVLGTDSLQKKQVCGGLARGERVRLEWSVPNVFSDGEHSVEVMIHDRYGLVVYDSWKEAAKFRVVKEEKTPYIITPNTSLDLERIQ